jgi:excisionase family DNA binding protein
MDREVKREGQLYTIAEVQRLLAIGRSKAYALVATRELPAVKIGNCLRVRGEDLIRFVEANRY